MTRQTESKNERELGRRARKLMTSSHGCSSKWGGGDIYPTFVSVGPLVIRRLDNDIKVHLFEKDSAPVPIYEEDKFGSPTKPLMPGAVKAALELLKQHMILDDLANV